MFNKVQPKAKQKKQEDKISVKDFFKFLKQQLETFY
jgi:hypothetical protein